VCSRPGGATDRPGGRRARRRAHLLGDELRHARAHALGNVRDGELVVLAQVQEGVHNLRVARAGSVRLLRRAPVNAAQREPRARSPAGTCSSAPCSGPWWRVRTPARARARASLVSHAPAQQAACRLVARHKHGEAHRGEVALVNTLVEREQRRNFHLLPPSARRGLGQQRAALTGRAKRTGVCAHLGCSCRLPRCPARAEQGRTRTPARGAPSVAGWRDALRLGARWSAIKTWHAACPCAPHRIAELGPQLLDDDREAARHAVQHVCAAQARGACAREEPAPAGGESAQSVFRANPSHVARAATCHSRTRATCPSAASWRQCPTAAPHAAPQPRRACQSRVVARARASRRHRRALTCSRCGSAPGSLRSRLSTPISGRCRLSNKPRAADSATGQAASTTRR
jgi:hypothetical protein